MCTLQLAGLVAGIGFMVALLTATAYDSSPGASTIGTTWATPETSGR